MKNGLKTLLCGLALTMACGGEDFDPNDADRDGFTIEEGDCNDANAAVFPGAPEPCDDIDNNCDGTKDEGDKSLHGHSPGRAFMSTVFPAAWLRPASRELR